MRDFRIYERMLMPGKIMACACFLILVCSSCDSDKRALARAEEGIEAHRKSDAVIEVRNSGELVEGARVKAELTRHAFHFGANIHLFGRLKDEKDERIYRERFAALFNYATIGLYWASLEKKQGEWDHERVKAILDWCDSQGIEVKGHSLIWIEGAGIPVWSKKMPSDARRKEYVRRIISGYKDRIHVWEILNEPVHHEAMPFAPLHEVARKVAPEAKLIVNDFGYYEELERLDEFFREQEKNSHLYDAIGIQAHAPEHTWFRPGKWTKVLDRMAGFGKPLHITEFFLPSDGSTVEGVSCERKWDEETQAEAAVEFYKICFGHPSVEAISWWDLSDRHAWREGSGLLRDDLSEKPAYKALSRLINETWHTSAEGRTGPAGTYKFKGFSGSYDVFVETPDGLTRTGKITIEPGKANHTVIEIP